MARVNIKYRRNWGLSLLLAASIWLPAHGFLYAQTKEAGAEPAISEINQGLKRISLVKDTNTKLALALIDKTKKICRMVNIDTLTARLYGEEAYCNSDAGNFRRAILLYDSCAILWKKHRLDEYLKAEKNKATSLMYNSEYYKALLTFFECLKLSKATGNKKLSGQILNNIGLVYESVGDADNAVIYEKKALEYKRGINDSVSIARTYGNLGDAFLNKKMIDSAIMYEKRSYNIFFLAHEDKDMAISLGDIGNMYREKHLLDSSIAYLLRAFIISRKLVNMENSVEIEDDLAESYFLNHDLKNTWKYVSLAIPAAPQISDTEVLHDHYSLLYQYFKKTGDTAGAFSYLEKLNAVNDSIFKEKINIQNEKVASEYEYKQRKLQDSLVFQSHISASEQKATASRNKLYVSLLLLLIAVLLAAVWYTRSKLLEKKNLVVQQNYSLQEQKIRELENEKQILASQAVLKGQEDERSRLARDLHDGLGGLLSGVKHSIINMKENIMIGADHAEAFEKSLNMIDVAMKELRRVAQNMMPEALAKFGLEEALKDYCASSSSASFKVIFQSFGESMEIENSVEIIIYRVVQELVNNAVKHARATQLMVQLVRGDGWITISVEDNGTGFNIDSLKHSTGAGWSNIKSRVDYLKGNIDLKSQEGTGTSVNIEINISQS
jgi:signal transduction histidine kinase